MDHISVCICTFKRPKMLARTLEGLTCQSTNSAFSFEVVVVDNDYKRSAEDIVRSFQENKAINIIYDCEPEQNISLARNRAIHNAKGNLIAFIDDDEFPERNWLLNLFNAYRRFSTDGIFGPVIPYYTETTPKWLIKSGLCVRSTFLTGTILNDPKYMRTGNVLFNRNIVKTETTPFTPSRGRTGGEDADFFRRMLKKGFRFAWCNEAIVNEMIPRERQKRLYYIRRALIRGVTTAEHESFVSLGTLKSVIAVSVYTVLLPFLLVMGQHWFMKYLVKDCDHVGKLFALCGIKLVSERSF